MFRDIIRKLCPTGSMFTISVLQDQVITFASADDALRCRIHLPTGAAHEVSLRVQPGMTRRVFSYPMKYVDQATLSWMNTSLADVSFGCEAPLCLQAPVANLGKSYVKTLITEVVDTEYRAVCGLRAQISSSSPSLAKNNVFSATEHCGMGLGHIARGAIAGLHGGAGNVRLDNTVEAFTDERRLVAKLTLLSSDFLRELSEYLNMHYRTLVDVLTQTRDWVELERVRDIKDVCSNLAGLPRNFNVREALHDPFQSVNLSLRLAWLSETLLAYGHETFAKRALDISFSLARASKTTECLTLGVSPSLMVSANSVRH